MKLHHLTAFFSSILVCSHALAQAPSMDKELADLAEKLSPQVKDHAKKKVAVLDFTDLQGESSELGRYVAEQLSVNLVMGRRDFSVLDRANLKSILAEHKLTAKGLVDPENAKKLGQFAGVDALILGTIIPKNQSVSLTAKIITTDTAEIVGAARAEFRSDDTIQQLLSHPAKADQMGSEPSSSPPGIAAQQFGNLTIQLRSVRGLPDDSASVTLLFQNKDTKNSIAVALHSAPMPHYLDAITSLVLADGTEYLFENATGIRLLNSNPNSLTEIAPGESLQVSLKYRAHRMPAESISSATLQAELVINSNYSERSYLNYRQKVDVLPPECRIRNLMFEIPLKPKK
jgi:TolB-like protein